MDVESLRSTEASFVALTRDGTLVAWGMASCGGQLPSKLKESKAATRPTEVTSDTKDDAFNPKS